MRIPIWTMCVIFTYFVCGSNAVSNEPIPPPVILVPGDGGTQLFGRLNKTETPHFFCTKQTSDFFVLWLDLKSFAPIAIDCLADNMRLNYDPNTRQSNSVPGVEVEIRGWGDTHTVEYLSSLQVLWTEYFYPLVNMLVNKLGYIRGKNVRAAPYDFRRAPTESQSFFDRLKVLIEETYEMNNQSSVILLAHSMGCLYTHHFIIRQDEAWKAKYIRAFISTAGPFGGAMPAMEAQISGDNLDIGILKSLWLRPAQRSWSSTAYLMPTESSWADHEVLVMGPTRNYTVRDYHHLFQDIKYPLGYNILRSLSNITDHTQPPGVPTYCILGRQVKTVGQLDYRTSGKAFPDVSPTVIYDDGDGTVNWRSLTLCSKWKNAQPHPVSTEVMIGAPHLEIVRDIRYVNYIQNIIEDMVAETAFKKWLAKHYK